MIVTINRFIAFVFLLFFLLDKNVFAAGALDISGGLSVDYKSYSRDNSSTYKEVQQLDRLYLEGEFSRDFYARRLGEMYLKFDFSKYNLNYFEDKNGSLGVPFVGNKEADRDGHFLHDIKSKLLLNIPKADIKILLEYDEKTDFSVKDTGYFTKIGKMSDDIADLKGLVRSLEDRDKFKSQNYFMSRDGNNFNFMSNYNRYDYDKRFEKSNYLSKEEIFSFGLDFRKNFGMYYEKNDKFYKTGQSNETINKYKIGLIDYFGNDILYSFDKIKIKGYYQLVKNEYEDKPFNNKYGILGARYDINKDRSIYFEYDYKVNYDKYTSDLENNHNIKLKYDYNKSDLSYYLYLKNSYVKRKYQSIDNNMYNYTEINSILSNQIKGSGSIRIISLATNFLNLNLTIDGSAYVNNVLVTSGSDIVITFTKSIKGTISNITGDQNDLSFLLSRDYSGGVKQIPINIDIGYNFRKNDLIRSKLDLSYEYVKEDVLDYPISNLNYEDKHYFKLYKLFEIRPFNFIFDKSLIYSIYSEGEDRYNEYVLGSSDGFYSKKIKLYLKSEYSQKKADGLYNDMIVFKESVVYDYLSDDLEIAFVPSYSREITKGEQEKRIRKLDMKLNYNKNSLSTHYSQEKIDNLIAYKTEENVYKTLKYKYDLKNIIISFDYQYNKNNTEFEYYSPSVTYIIYKVFPQNEPYLIFDLGTKFEKTKVNNYNNNEKYAYFKLTYKPTMRLEGVFAYEKSINRSSTLPNNEGDDYELLLSYKTKVFKLSLGYRNSKIFYNGERRDENVFYFKVDKSFNYYARVK